MCVLAKCNILNQTSNDYFDSFVLSESSLFVYPTKVMIKTCGTTTLLNAIPKILEYAREFDLPLQFVQYSRKNFLFPQEQLFPHRDWNSEVEYLDTYFDGTAYVMGPLKGDHWCVYVADYSTEPHGYNTSSSDMSSADAASTLPELISSAVSALDIRVTGDRKKQLDVVVNPALNCGDGNVAPCERTLEIMMEELDTTIAKTFFRREDVGDTDKYPGMADLLLGGGRSETDEYNFTPCGYSMNGLNKESYYTIHVTPEQHCSYASFETNYASSAASRGLVSHVLSTFKPGRVTLVFSYTPNDTSSVFHSEIPGYVLRHKSITSLADGAREVIVCGYESCEKAASTPKRSRNPSSLPL